MKQKITSEISELAGLFAADGSMQRNHLCFWGNPIEDKDYYDIHLKSLFLKSFNMDIRPHHKKSNSVYGFYVCDKRIISYFNEILGFPIGRKTYSLTVPSIIYENKDNNIISAFLRGFCAGDGCLSFDKRYGNYRKILTIIHTYPRIQIRSVSKELLLQLLNMLERLNIVGNISRKKSKKPNEVDSYLLQISGKTRLKTWIDKIGFSNPNHSTRYEIFKKHGFVPSNTTYIKKDKTTWDLISL
jgi:intein/homing endonuclease